MEGPGFSEYSFEGCGWWQTSTSTSGSAKCQIEENFNRRSYSNCPISLNLDRWNLILKTEVGITFATLHFKNKGYSLHVNSTKF